MVHAFTQPTFPQKDNPHGFEMAGAIIETCTDRLQGAVSELLLNPGDSELRDKRVTNELIVQLGLRAPAMLLYILPAVCEDLKVDELDVRHDAVRVLGRLFSSEAGPGGVHLSQTYHANFHDFCQRFHDRDPAIRRDMVSYGALVLGNVGDPTGAVSAALIKRAEDLDQDVRLQVVTAVCGVAKDALEVVSLPLLRAVGNRVFDRKVRLGGGGCCWFLLVVFIVFTDVDVLTCVVLLRASPLCAKKPSPVWCKSSTSSCHRCGRRCTLKSPCPPPTTASCAS